MNAPARLVEVTVPTVAFTLDQQTLHAFEGETILKAAQRHCGPTAIAALVWWRSRASAPWRQAAAAT